MSKHRYTVFQQNPPVAFQTGRVDSEGRPIVEWHTNLVTVGEVMAKDGAEAIDIAKELPIFQIASRSTLRAYPIVERVEE